jgi:hypothetical protein
VIPLHSHAVTQAADDQMLGGEHAIVLVALLYLPVAVTGLLLALEAGGRAGYPQAVRLRNAYLTSRPTVRMAAFGMAVSATIHLSLAPSHWSEDHVRAVLFALDGVTLGVVAVCAVMTRFRGWRTLASALLGIEVLAYAGYVVAGAEQLDVVGVATKLVEVSGIGLVLVGSAHRLGFGGEALRNLASPRAHGGFLR